jgi:hypothetical protein
MDLLDDDSVIDLRPRGKKTDPAAFIEQQRRRASPVPAENAPLRDWERSAEPSAPAAPAELGLCVKCGTRPARSRCAQCGEAVCATDAWSLLGLCKACVAANVAPQ